MCENPIEIGIINFIPIMDNPKSLIREDGQISFADGDIVFGVFHGPCLDYGLTVEFEKLQRVLLMARNNIFRGDF